jgi:predicted CXXCH cytochrome family protein
VEGAPLVTIFGGKVTLPNTYFRGVPVLPIKYGRGHPVERHPVSDVMDSQDSKKVSKVLNCMTCHQPHSSAKPGLLINDQANNTQFCSTCHTGLLGATEAQTSHGTSGADGNKGAPPPQQGPKQ